MDARQRLLARGLRPYVFADLKAAKNIRVLRLIAATNYEDELLGELFEFDLSKVPTAVKDREGPQNYEALSWVWGREEDTKILNLDNKAGERFHFPIRPTMDRCLRRLRSKERSRYLWVDIFCINQSLNSERDAQVAIMRQIYEKSLRVCIWLGEGDKENGLKSKDVAATFDFINEIRDTRSDRFWHGRELEWHKLQDIMMNPWFSRRWVIQEVALAPGAEIICGSERISWERFTHAVSLFVDAEPMLHLSEAAKARPELGHKSGLFSNVHMTGAAQLIELERNISQTTGKGSHGMKTLEYLVSRLPMFDCLNPRDTIYCLLAISKDTAAYSGNFWDASGRNEFLHACVEAKQEKAIREGTAPWDVRKLERMFHAGKRIARLLGRRFAVKSYPVTYHLHPVDVYRQFIESSIRTSKSLDILCRPWAPAHDLDKEEPYKLKRETSDLQDQCLTQSFENGSTSGPDELSKPKELSSSKLPSWVCSKDRTTFYAAEVTGGYGLKRMKRRNADTFVGLPGKTLYSASGATQARIRTLRFRRRSEYDQSIFVEGFEVDQIAKVGQMSLGGMIPKTWLTFAGYSQDAGVPNDLYRTLVGNREPRGAQQGSNPPAYYRGLCDDIMKQVDHEGSLNVAQEIESTDNTVKRWFLERLRAVVSERVIFRTSRPTASGRLGLGPGGDDATGAVDGTDGVRRGDLVFILHGCSVPVILRRKRREGEELEQEMKDFQKIRFAQRYIRAVELAQRHFRFRYHMRLAKRELQNMNPTPPTEVIPAPRDRAPLATELDHSQRQPTTAHPNATSEASSSRTKRSRQPVFDEHESEGRAAKRQKEVMDNGLEQRAKEIIRQIGAADDKELKLKHTQDQEGERAFWSQFERAGASLRKKIANRDKLDRERLKIIGDFNGSLSGLTEASEEAEIDQRLEKFTKRVDDRFERMKKELDFASEQKIQLTVPEMPPDPNPDPAEYYQLIGEAYIDGLMDGEAFEERTEKDQHDTSNLFKDKILEIR